jgi:hemerythrin-like domain-containing protein
MHLLRLPHRSTNCPDSRRTAEEAQVTEEVVVDVTDMYAAHDSMRKEFASLPLLVKSIPDGDVDSANRVSDHIALLDRFLRIHHDVEDEALWPLVRERAPEHEAIFTMDAEHHELNEQLDAIGGYTNAWRVGGSADTRATLHNRLIIFERALLRHLGHEEREVLPLIQQTLSQKEYDAFGPSVQQRMDPDDRLLALGFILEDTSTSLGNAILLRLPEETRAETEREARSTAQKHKRALLSM